MLQPGSMKITSVECMDEDWLAKTDVYLYFYAVKEYISLAAGNQGSNCIKWGG